MIQQSVHSTAGDEGSQHQMAEVAIALSAARQLVWRANPEDGFAVALAGVAARDCLQLASAVAGAALDEPRWLEFQMIRALVDHGIRESGAGSDDLARVAEALLAGTSHLGGVA
jgi:hypothetical protein